MINEKKALLERSSVLIIRVIKKLFLLIIKKFFYQKVFKTI